MNLDGKVNVGVRVRAEAKRILQAQADSQHRSLAKLLEQYLEVLVEADAHLLERMVTEAEHLEALTIEYAERVRKAQAMATAQLEAYASAREAFITAKARTTAVKMVAHAKQAVRN